MTTVILDGTECEVVFSSSYNVFSVWAENEVTVSLESGKGEGDDGVITVPGGESRMYPHMRGLDRIFITGSGRAEVFASNEAVNPFKSAPINNGGVTASGNSVQLDGLQGGVPFSEMVVSGKNLLGIAQHKKIYGNDAHGYWIVDDETSRTIIQKLMPNSTYTIKKYDNGNYFRLVLFKNEPTGVKSPALQKVNDDTGITNKYTFITDTEYLWLAYEPSFEESDAIEPIAQLELGTEATAYEPPITGRELTLNVNGTDYTITPDSNPYTIPNDIRQVDGLNNVSVSAGGISVVGVRKNAAIKRIWGEIDEIKTAIIVSNGESE